MTEVFELQFKNSIRYGMTYEQFWFDDPQLYYTYEEVYLDGLKEKDILNWQLAYYFRLAVDSLLRKECKFPDKPIFYQEQQKNIEKPKNAVEMRDFVRNHIKPTINNKF